MSHDMFHESGQDGRSVLGMLSVQVERDPKTGATVVRSVAPVTSNSGASVSVFDDGRRSIHAVGVSSDQPSSEELGQILSAIDGVGMKVLLDDVTVTNTQEDQKQVPKVEPEARPEILRSSPGAPKARNGTTTVVQDMEGREVNISDQNLERPVTLLFLGYDDSATDPDDASDAHGGMLTVERVIITEDGQVLEPEQVQAPEEDPPETPSPGQDAQVNTDTREEPAAVPTQNKHKKCRCCSVM